VARKPVVRRWAVGYLICRPPIRVSPLTAIVVTSGDPGPFGLANP
jgi:hypothetical protein